MIFLKLDINKDDLTLQEEEVEKVVEVPITIYYQDNVHEYSKMRPIYDWWKLLKPLIFLRIGIWR